MKNDYRKNFSRWARLLCVTAALATINAWAEPRALLIGVGEYQNSTHNLPGIDSDVEIMRDVAGRLGYLDSQIKVLQNKQVTRENLRRVFDEWLVQGVTEDDKVLIYYSGHGSQLPDQQSDGDEEDGYDETLTLYELATEGAKDLGMLRDDDLAEMIDRIPARHTSFIVDACCSGTTSKSLTIGKRKKLYKSKSYACPSHSVAGKSTVAPAAFFDNSKGFGVEATVESASRVVYLSAAQDHEAAQAGPDGSIFTLGLKAAFDADRNASPEQLQALTARYVAEKLETTPSLIFHPNLVADENLSREKALFVVGRQPARAVALERWREIASAGEGQLTLLQPRTAYSESEAIDFAVDMPFDGYLNVVSVDSNDSVKIMFPNKYAPENNRRPQGLLELPNDPGFQWVAQAPHGKNRYIVIATREPFNLHSKSLDYKNGEPLADFLTPSIASVRGMSRPSEKTTNRDGSDAARISYHAGIIEFTTCTSGC